MISLLLTIFSSNVFACTMCTGQNSNDKYYVYVIIAFTLLIYVPLLYMFKTFIKYKNINTPPKSDS